jgi:LicD family
MRPLSDFDNLDRTLQKGVDQIKRYHYVLNAGTALGLYRDGDFIPNDTDIDVVILTDEPFEIGPLEGFEVYQNFDNGVPVQRCFQDKDNGAIFDIYFYYRKPGNIAVSPYSHDLVIPLGLYYNRKKLNTKYGKFYFPSPIEDYLQANYGLDWRTPKEDKGIFT